MKKRLTYLLVVLCAYVALAQKKIDIDIQNDIVIPKNYIVHKVTSHILVDGKDNESAWKKTSFTDSFIDIKGIKVPKQETKVKMLWDDHYLYVFAKLEETQIWGTLKTRDTIIFYNNDFEIFINPSNDTYDYGEIEVNALNTIWDLMLDKPYRTKGKAISYWNLNNLRSAVHIEGTLNNPTDIDQYWSVEIAIPMAALYELEGSHNPIKEGEQWRINFSRVEWDYDLIKNKYSRKKVKGKYLPEYNWVWSNQKVINMHEPEKWGYLQFSETPPSTPTTFNKPKDLVVRQVIFALFRNYLNGKAKIPNIKIGQQQYFEPFIVNHKKFKGYFLKTYQGYEILLRDLETHLTFIINQDGHLQKQEP